MSDERKFRLQVTEGELLALIHHHSRIVQNFIEDETKPAIIISERLHDLVKRLHKTTPDIEEVKQEEPIAQPEAMVTSGASKSGW